MNKTWIMVAIVLMSAVTSAYFYGLMPEKIVSHWDENGTPNGYMDRFWGLAVMPLISVFLLVLLKVIPSIDPKWGKVKKFGRYYENFIVIMLAFMFYIQIMSIAWNLGYAFDFTRAFLPAFAALFYYIGVVMQHAEPNWFIGIRTPWTLSSPKVWEKTHKKAAIAFKATGVLTLASIALPGTSFLIIIGLILAASLYLVIYSYFEYQKEKGGTRNDSIGRKVQVRKMRKRR